DRATGGSSSGSAVAVAIGAAFASLGSDSGGSIRTPASWCGICGLKPTRGAIPTTGVMPLSATMDSVGIMARTAADLAAVFPLLTGADGMDAQARGAVAWEESALERALATQPRLGVIDRWFEEDLSEDVASGLDAIRRTWAEELGARVVSADFNRIAETVAHARTVLLREAWDTHEPLLEHHDSLYSAGVKARLLAGSEIDPAALRAALEALPGLQQALLDQAFRNADVLLLPATPTTAPRIDQTDLAAITDPAPAILRQVDGITRCLRPFNLLGVPSLVLPGGMDREGMPFGFQLVGRPGAEASLLGLGMRWQAATDWHQRRPPGWEAE
ncbi:MAG: amidase, partial [Pseudomonadota bacterium]|nr:amidase [Pseudomonadota bacterium]